MLGNFSYCNPPETLNVKYKDVIIYKKLLLIAIHFFKKER